MHARLLPLIAAAVVLVFLGLTCLYTVNETEVALHTRFGAILEAGSSAGLHWKLPWDQVVKLDRRVLTEEHVREGFVTRDGRTLLVDYFIKWRIQDPVRYYESTGGSESSAAARLYDWVRQGMRRVLAERTEEQVVTADGPAISAALLEQAAPAAAPLGIQLIDVGVQNLDLPEEVATRVYDGMRESFNTLANRRRAEGASAAASIRAAADRQRTEIIANADREALEIKGSADAQAADIYAHAYAAQPDFYAFYRSLQAYERSLGKPGDVLVLTPDSEFFKYLKDPGQATHR